MSHPDTSYQILSQWAFLFRTSSKLIFTMATVAAILYFWSEWFWLFFYLQVTSMILIMFQVSSGEEAKNMATRAAILDFQSEHF